MKSLPLKLVLGIVVFIFACIIAALWYYSYFNDDGPGGGETLTVVTYNVLADRETVNRRIPALLELAEAARPDVIVLQECLPGVLLAFQKSETFGNYSCVPDDAQNISGGLAIISRYPVRKRMYRNLESRQGRGVLVAVLDVKGTDAAVATVHLESFLEDGALRARQLDTVFGMIRDRPEAILAGDFNFGDNEEPETTALDASFTDCWKSLRPGEAGYTWNIEKSDMARRGSFPKETSRRLDRVFVKSTAWKPAQVEIIGDGEISPGLFPSDHFGLKAVLEK